MQNVEVLISAMNLLDTSLLESTNIQTDAVLINQSNLEDYQEINYKSISVKFFSTLEKGLSKSRNKAIDLATGDICLICDDDENLHDNYEKLILKAYSEIPDADVIAFKFKYPGKKYDNSIKSIGYLNASTISSVEITFKRKKIVESKIRFNEYFGAGSVYALGEENLFLFDCLDKGLKIYYVPIEIGSVKQEESTWFNGFNQKYFFDKGAWLSECFPILKYFLIFYVVFRFRKVAEISKQKIFQSLWSGMKANISKLSFLEYNQKRNK
jgi:glycosyltransferase involved in cell wall biosynthesis